MKKQTLITKISAGLLALGIAGTANAIPIIGQDTWETTLQGRDLDGNVATFEAYYDTTNLSEMHPACSLMKTVFMGNKINLSNL